VTNSSPGRFGDVRVADLDRLDRQTPGTSSVVVSEFRIDHNDREVVLAVNRRLTTRLTSCR